MSYENFAICAMLLRKGRARAPAGEIVSVEMLSASFNRIGSSRASGGGVRSGSEAMFGPLTIFTLRASSRTQRWQEHFCVDDDVLRLTNAWIGNPQCTCRSGFGADKTHFVLACPRPSRKISRHGQSKGV